MITVRRAISGAVQWEPPAALTLPPSGDFLQVREGVSALGCGAHAEPQFAVLGAKAALIVDVM